MTEINFLSAAAMADGIRNKLLSPVELIAAHLGQIERLNPKLNAFVQIDPEPALRQAKDAESKIQSGELMGPLHGVPVSIKSSIEVAGMRCEAGSKIRTGVLATNDAPLVTRLRNAGAIVLGTTNTPEFLMAWETDNLLYGRTNNPWDLARTPGGSSGGEAAAIASGCSAGGVGSDLKKLRIGYFEDDGRTPVTPETRVAVRTAADALRRAGFTVEPFRPDGLEQARQTWWKFFGIAGGMLLGPMTRGREAELSPILKQFSAKVSAQPAHTGQSLLNAWIERDLVRFKIFAQMRDHPILLCPVAAIPAFRHGERSWQVEGRTVEYLDAWSYTEWFNLLGTPAVSVPLGKSETGLPIGVQLSARPWEEELVLSVAEILEKECGGFREPPIS